MTDETEVAEAVETIVRAAIQHGKTVYSVMRPGRHHDVFRSMTAAGYETMYPGAVQGFCTYAGRFVDRTEARKIAEAADQIIASRTDANGVPYKFEHVHLFSEDVW